MTRKSEDGASQRSGSGSSSRRRISNISEESSKAFFAILQLVFLHKWKVIIPFFLTTPVAAFWAYSLPPLYRSSTLILVERQQVPQEYVTATDTSSVSERLNTIKQQILSRTNLERIIKEFKLFKEEPGKKAGLLFEIHNKLKAKENAWKNEQGLFFRVLNKLVRKGISALGQEGNLTREEVVGIMRKAITVEVLGSRNKSRGDAFTVNFEGKDPRTTMEVAAKIASLFIEENLRLREQYAEGTSEFLVNELQKARQELEEQEGKVQAFKQKHMGSLPGQLDANLRTLDRLQLELKTTMDSIRVVNDNKNLLERQIKLASAAPPAPTSPGTPTTQTTNLEQLKATLSSLLTVYKENYPDVIMVKNQIAKLEQLKAEKKKTEAQEPTGEQAIVSQEELNVMALNAQVNNLRNREKEIRKEIKTFERRVEVTPANEQKLTAILRNYGISQQNYQSLLAKKMNAKLAENLEKKQKGERFRVIDPANFPEKPFKPNRSRIILFGMALGPGLGLGLILLLDFLNPSFKNAEDFDGIIPQPVLAVIPTIDLPKGNVKRGRQKKNGTWKTRIARIFKRGESATKG